MTNSADPDQLAFSDLELHCLQTRVYPGSAGQGLNTGRKWYKKQNKTILKDNSSYHYENTPIQIY